MTRPFRSFDITAQGVGQDVKTIMHPRLKLISDAVRGLHHKDVKMHSWKWEAGEYNWKPTSTHERVNSNLQEVEWWRKFNRCAYSASHPFLADTNSMKSRNGVPMIRLHCEYDEVSESANISLNVPVSLLPILKDFKD
jgi:hypothetical protein